MYDRFVCEINRFGDVESPYGPGIVTESDCSLIVRDPFYYSVDPSSLSFSALGFMGKSKRFRTFGSYLTN